MIKKIVFSICALFSLFLMFIFGFDSINILAINSFDSSIGSYNFNIDIDNYNRENLVDYNNYTFTYANFWSSSSQYVYNEIKTISTTMNNNNKFGINNLNFYGNYNFKENTMYTFSFDRTQSK
jgi:hypothetical protein